MVIIIIRRRIIIIANHRVVVSVFNKCFHEGKQEVKKSGRKERKHYSGGLEFAAVHKQKINRLRGGVSALAVTSSLFFFFFFFLHSWPDDAVTPVPPPRSFNKAAKPESLVNIVVGSNVGDSFSPVSSS